MSVVFGTSGLRGPSGEFDAAHVEAHIRAFLDHIDAQAGERVFVGCDRRASSPEIAARVIASIEANGQQAHWCGVTPTPAVALAAMTEGAPAIVVTGSHIPEAYNGIKFYRHDGELLKSDETPIKQAAARYLETRAEPARVQSLPCADSAISAAYIDRYLQAFADDLLQGVRLGLFEHSAAGRDLLAGIFSGLGVELVRFGRSERFVAVDTEALDQETVAACAVQIEDRALNAVISSDGDGDRPLLIDADGVQMNGDVLCTLAARELGIETIVTPLTSTSAIEKSGWFKKVIRTRIGSPYVVDAMREHGGAALAGFEANGGFLLGSELALAAGPLSALPTRDAVLPLVAVLGACRQHGRSLAELSAELPSRVMKADRLPHIPHDVSAALLEDIVISPGLRRRLAPELEVPVSTDLTDGVRFVTVEDEVIHLRASGNAPELRVYVETGDAVGTDLKLKTIVARLAECLSTRRTQRESMFDV